ncbi:hypothetical protein FA048_15710 [Pedobacter polaris]|uniref:Lipoprotein n=1 Tax=Pedobacter polaris TaxID=2571273 RepID=A0A4U1CIW3_9SPHI|nr:hypothetical protein [Pedobacter polaris]TKC06650.1 hypothetical protein FA048_15710 [Pedobacter polaris]
MNKQGKRMNRVSAEAFGTRLIILALGLFSGCTNSNSDPQVLKNDTVVAIRDSGLRQVADSQSIKKKHRYVPPQINQEAIQRAVISKHDSSFHVYNNIMTDYRIIGYEAPDTTSRKMVLFSIFTSDVKDNPFHCPYGSYYYTGYPVELVIKYTGEQESFIKAHISGESKKPATVYFEKKWVEFDE